ncbi:hypothetical protein [Nocardioides insulae]|uniref:hypothetical protein n=1 Tax=Nocardioides insulae TaxID=394734 RepID=UPI000419D03A|nr:hypothetical protein [Nocardioides insulae]
MNTVSLRPVPLLVAAGLGALQSVVLIGWAVFEMLDLTPGRATMAITTSIFLLGYGAALAVCVWGLLGHRYWSRGPVVLTQLIQLGLAWNFRDAPMVALALAAFAVATLVCAVHPATSAALDADDS